MTILSGAAEVTGRPTWCATPPRSASARFRDRLARRADATRVAEDVDSADLSGVSGTPAFFVNGRRHYGSYDIAALTEVVRAA